MYSFDWETPAFGGQLKSPHSVEVPFVFDTLGVIGEGHHKPGAQALADRVSKTWATLRAQRRSGQRSDPGVAGLYRRRGAPRCFSTTQCKVVDDPDGEVRPLWSKVATA